MDNIERFLIIDPLCLNNDVYFKECGNTTKCIKEALIVNSISEGDEIAKQFTIYKPIYKPIYNRKGNLNIYF